MNTQVDLVEEIIRELIRLEPIPVEARSEDDDFSLPRMINAGNGESLFVSRKLDEGSSRLAKRLMDEPSLKIKFTQAEWRAIVRRAFGPHLPLLTSMTILKRTHRMSLSALSRRSI